MHRLLWDDYQAPSPDGRRAPSMNTLDTVFDIPAIASVRGIEPETEPLRCHKPGPVPDDDEDDDEDDDRGSSGGNIDPDDDEGDFDDEDDEEDETLWTRPLKPASNQRRACADGHR
jgi:hypothetical protein